MASSEGPFDGRLAIIRTPGARGEVVEFEHSTPLTASRGPSRSPQPDYLSAVAG
jgi:hypothetical protein